MVLACVPVTLYTTAEPLKRTSSSDLACVHSDLAVAAVLLKHVWQCGSIVQLVFIQTLQQTDGRYFTQNRAEVKIMTRTIIIDF